MADIIGMGFDDYVQTQVLKRQEKLRYGQTDLDVIRWNNTNNAFLRLTSGVNVDDNFVKNNLGLDSTIYSGNKLAKHFKLFAAQTYDKDKNQYSFTKGVGYSFNSSYGFASPEYTSYGLVPPPGLISANIKALNRGSLREATVQIQCHNLQQFQIIEALYLRLKYSILLEWGHSMYFNNIGELVQSNHDLSNGFLDGNYNQTKILSKIQEERKASDGNYDAFFGLITNFEWTVRPDGGYDITLIARATGDVIESLKINSNTKFNEEQKALPSGSIDSLIDKDRYKTTLNRLLYAIAVNVVPNYPGLQSYAHGTNDPSLAYALNNDKLSSSTGLTPAKYQNFDTTNRNNLLTGYEAKTWIFNNLSESRYKRQHYIKLGALLRIIDSFLIIYNDKSKDDPLFKIDYDFDNNFCFTIPDHISVDPKVCLIPYPTTNTVSSLASGSITYDQEEYELTVTTLFDSTQKNIQDLQKFGGSEYSGGTVVKLSSGEYALVTINTPTKQTGLPYNIPGTTYPSIQTFPQTTTPHIESAFISELQSNTADLEKEADVVNRLTSAWFKQARKESAEYQINYITDVKVDFDIKKTLATKITETGTVIRSEIAGVFDRTGIPSGISSGPVITRYTNNDIEKRKTKIIIQKYYNSNFTGVTTSSTGTGVYESLEKMNNNLEPYAFKDLSDDKNYTAKTMHIHVNIEYVCKILANNYNVKTGELNLYNFLDKLMNGIQNALCNINNFEIIYKEETNTFKIIDNTFIPGQFNSKINLRKGIVEFLISANGEKGIGGGSFIKNINFRTKLSNAFATMTTIGAQKNGAVVGADSTALSKWNTGLEDRIITTKTNPNGRIDNTSDIDTEFIQNKRALQSLVQLVNNSTVSDNHISQYKNSINDFFRARISSSVLKNKYPGIGFIPFDLEVNMMGLSGPRIYESYTIDTKLLPKSYQDSIQFICSGISHNISNGEWTTTLNSICGPKQQGITVQGMDKLNLLQIKSKTNSITALTNDFDSLCPSIGSSTTARVHSSTMIDNAKKIAPKLKALLLSEEAICGLIGCLIAESGLNYQAWNIGSTNISTGATVITNGSGRGDKLDSYSPLKLTYKGKNITAYGIAQWTQKRKEDYYTNYTKNGATDSLELQADYVAYELKNIYNKTVLDKLKAINSSDPCAILKATMIALYFYEGVPAPKLVEDRYKNALGLQGKL